MMPSLPAFAFAGRREAPCIAASGCKKSRARFGLAARSTRRARPTLPRSAAAPDAFEETSDPSSRSLRSALRRPASSPCQRRLIERPRSTGSRARRDRGLAIGIAVDAASYRAPPVTLLKRQAVLKLSDQLSQSAVLGHARLLGDVLADFGVKGEIKGAHPGPVVTLARVRAGARDQVLACDRFWPMTLRPLDERRLGPRRGRAGIAT